MINIIIQVIIREHIFPYISIPDLLSPKLIRNIRVFLCERSNKIFVILPFNFFCINTDVSYDPPHPDRERIKAREAALFAEVAAGI